LFSGEWDLLDPVSGKKSLYDYLTELGKRLPPLWIAPLRRFLK
jgi:hypothetical protein